MITSFNTKTKKQSNLNDLQILITSRHLIHHKSSLGYTHYSIKWCIHQMPILIISHVLGKFEKNADLIYVSFVEESNSVLHIGQTEKRHNP